MDSEFWCFNGKKFKKKVSFPWLQNQDMMIADLGENIENLRKIINGENQGETGA